MSKFLQFLNLFLFLLFLFNSQKIYSQVATLEATLKLEKVDAIAVPYQSGMPLPSFEKQNHKILDLAGTWKKERTKANDNITLAKRDSAGYANLINEAGGRFLTDYNDSDWTDKNLPAVENEMHTYPTVPEYFNDGVWYRRTFEVDFADSGKFAKIIFLCANYVADVWINGEYIGYHEGGYTPFAFDVSSHLKFGQVNTIAVRIDLIQWNKRNDVIPYKSPDWFNYGGIIRDVYIEFTDPVSVVRNDIIPLDIDGNIQSTIVLQNKNNLSSNTDVSIQVFEAAIDSNNISTDFSYELIGNEVSISGTNQTSLTIPADSISVWRTSIKIDNPKLWTPKNPNLYIMKVTVKEGSNVVDEFSSQFGVRTIAAYGNKVLLNNRVTFFTGAARHEDHPLYGRSLPHEVIFNDLKIVKSLNVNFLRTAHYPNDPYTYLILDRLGIAAMEEIPVYWFDEEEPWNIQNNSRKIHLQMFREMVFKDFNRPSIIMWSTSNECHEETGRLVYNQMVVDDHSQNYEDKRLISQSPAADNPGAADITQGPVDVAGWTMYFGIFHGSTYYGGTVNFIIKAQNNFPGKPILDTEFGYWSSENNSTLDDQVTVFNETFKAFKFFAALSSNGTVNTNGSLMGCTWWCVFDWYSDGHPNGFQSMGLYSMDRTVEKPVASTLRSSYLPYYNMDGVLVGVNEKKLFNDLPKKFELEQNFPNPFNPTTKIKYEIPASSNLPNGESLVQLKIYNILGREVVTLVNKQQQPGTYEVEFNSNVSVNNNSPLPSGVYFYQLHVGSYFGTKKMLLLK